MILINAILYLFLSNSFFKTERFPDIEVIKSDGNGITFRYLISENNIREEKVFVENRIYTTFIIEGAFYKEPIGSFDLPSREIFIGLPQSGDVSISAKAVKSKKVTNIEILPVPYKSWDRAPIYEIKDTVSKPLCEISTISWFRDNRIARLKINPIQYNFSYKEAIINTEIFVEIKFTSPAIDNYYHDYFDSVGADFILNWEIAKRWKKFQESKSFDYGMCKYPPGFTNWYKIQIESTGVYKISYNELKRAGIPVNIIDPRTIRIFNIGDYIPNVYYPDTLTEIPIYVTGENDGRLDKNDYILFFGVSPSRFSKDRSKFYTNPFTKYNYYWLTWGISLSFSGPGKRYTTIPSVTGGVPIYSANDYVHFEQDRDCPARNGLLWIWEYFSKGQDIPNRTFTIPVFFCFPETLLAISGRLYGRSTNNQVNVSVNGISLNTYSFPGAITNPPPFEFEITRAVPLADSNIIEFTLEGNWQQEIYLDYINCRYRKRLKFYRQNRELTFYSPGGNYKFIIVGEFNKPLIFDITDYNSPKIITDFYYRNDTLKFEIQVADTSYFYITDEIKARRVLKIERREISSIPEYANAHYYIVTPDELYNSALIIESYRKNNLPGIANATVKAVPLSRIFDNFSFGIEEPGAIKRLFKKYRPYYGLLLGDGTYDYRNILGLLNFPQLFSYETGYDIDYQVYSANAIALDAWYADFDGNGGTPDMALGRITARSSAEVRQFYNKLIAYENLNVGDWNRRIILLSDDEWKTQGIVDEFRFEHVINNENLEFSLLNTTNGRFRFYEPIKIYLTEYPFSESRDKRKAREAFLDAVNRGASLLVFFGHGAGFQLCHEQVLHISHIPLINNCHRNFIGFFGSCGVGRFEDTKYESIAEELVRKNDGAVVTVASSKATYSSVNYALAINFFRNLINVVDSAIGVTFLRAWLYDSTYHLFGDPATHPAIPNAFFSINVKDTFKPGERIYGKMASNNTNLTYITSTTSRWRRFYQSEVGSIYYNLLGYEIFRGVVPKQSLTDTLAFYFVVPIGLPRGIRYDVLNGAGYYTEIPLSSQVNGITYSQQDRTIICYLKDSIVFDTIMNISNSDRVGPMIEFLTEERFLKNYDTLNQNFILTVNLTDSSGILIAPIPGYNLRLVITRPSNIIVDEVDLASYFMYEIGKFTSGQIKYPIVLDTGSYKFTFYASDNLCNLSVDSVILNIARYPKLQILAPLFYLPSNSNNGFFTFELTKSASVNIKIYTLSGKLVKSISGYIGQPGYNQIPWDLKDASKNDISNGVYLYEITAISYDSGHRENAEIVEKMIIFR